VVWGLLIGFGALSVSAQSNDELEVFELVNRERIRYKLQPLIWDEEIASIARNYSRRMAREGFFDHYDPAGKSVADRARKADWDTIGENLFMGTDRNNLWDHSVRGWMRSPPHRKNIITKNFTGTGVGIAKSRDGNVYITQVFVEHNQNREIRRR
jgi:uncharacterized protein YkwD